MAKQAKLKPCPFCGSKAQMFGFSVTKGVGVYCTNDECGVRLEDMFTKENETYATMRTKKEAIKAWNRRPK